MVWYGSKDWQTNERTVVMGEPLCRSNTELVLRGTAVEALIMTSHNNNNKIIIQHNIIGSNLKHAIDSHSTVPNQASGVEPGHSSGWTRGPD